MIQISELTDKHKGRLVTYHPHPQNKAEQGRITSWNDLYVFVDYNNTGRGIATRPETLTFASA